LNSWVFIIDSVWLDIEVVATDKRINTA